MDALQAISAGFGNAQNVQNARATQAVTMPRERENAAQPSQPEQPAAAPSVDVSLSEAARAAAQSSANAPAAPVRGQEAVARASAVESTPRPEMEDAAAASTAAGREAVQRYTENANLPIGQSGPSTIRVSA